MKHQVFVYGTLMRQESNHRLLDWSDSRFIDAARLPRGLYSMISLGRFPGLVADPTGPVIYGEVYEVDDETLERLDALEGVPTLYRRERVEKLQLGRRRIARDVWVYVLSGHRWRGVGIPSGNWRDREAA